MARDVDRSARDFIPPHATLARLRQAVHACEGCDLYAHATQAVFGEGAARARVMLIGEQPGDREDREGRPFVGPAGRLLDKCLEAAGIDRRDVYVTNVVKHFKFTQAKADQGRTGRRLHKKPGSREIAACTPWLDEEVRVVKPEVVVCLGATAAQAVLARDFKVTESRGVFLPSRYARRTIATVHPSSLLRAPDEETRHRATARFVADLRAVARALVTQPEARA